MAEEPINGYEKVYHYRYDGYPAAFSTYVCESDSLIFYMQDKVFEAEQAKILQEEIKKDLSVISVVFDQAADETISVYVVERTIGDKCHAVAQSVYCVADDILSGNYRLSLIKACLSLSQSWMTDGAYGYLYGSDVDINEEQLADYYAKAEDLRVLSLFPAYECDTFTSEETRQVARDTCVAVASFVIDTYGADAFVSDITAEHKEAWLASLGVNRTYENVYDGFFNGATFDASREYPFIITLHNITYCFQRLEGEIESAQDIEELVYNTVLHIDACMEYLAENAPRNYTRVAQNMEGPITIRFIINRVSENQLLSSFTNVEKRLVTLITNTKILHEFAHIMFPKIDGTKKTVWKNEGLAEYLDFNIWPEDAIRQRYLYILSNDFTEGDDESQLARLIQSYYAQREPLPQTIQEFNAVLFVEAAATQSILNPQYESQDLLLTIPMDGSYGYGVPGDGNELTYMQACLFTSYLVERFTLDQMLDFCLDDLDFEEAFGQPYAEIKEEWLETLRESLTD